MKLSLKKKIIIGIVIAVIVFCATAQIITHILMKENFGRGEYPQYSIGYRYDFYEKDYPRRAVSFLSGENTLQGYVYGEENDKALIVVSHGIGNGHEGYINEIIWFVNQGYRVFAFDNTGSCESEGEGTTGLSQSALDLDAALTFIENDSELSVMPKLLFGHSWGGYAVTAVLNFEHEVTASVSVAGYAYPVEMITEFAQGMMGGMAYVMYPFIRLDNRMTFGEYAELSAVDGINKSGIPVLVIHGTGDETIGYDHSAIIAKKDVITNPNVEYLSITEEGSNGHSSIFYSGEANTYRVKLNEEFEGLKRHYHGEVPDDICQAFMVNINKAEANKLNLAMLESINSFYEKAVAD